MFRTSGCIMNWRRGQCSRLDVVQGRGKLGPHAARAGEDALDQMSGDGLPWIEYITE